MCVCMRERERVHGHAQVCMGGQSECGGRGERELVCVRLCVTCFICMHSRTFLCNVFYMYAQVGLFSRISLHSLIVLWSVLFSDTTREFLALLGPRWDWLARCQYTMTG